MTHLNDQIAWHTFLTVVNILSRKKKYDWMLNRSASHITLFPLKIWYIFLFISCFFFPLYRASAGQRPILNHLNNSVSYEHNCSILINWPNVMKLSLYSKPLYRNEKLDNFCWNNFFLFFLKIENECQVLCERIN